VKRGLGFCAVLALTLLAVGCATQPNRVPTDDISKLPRTLLPGAELRHARALAMGRARAQGWTIVQAAANRLLLERELPPDSPQALALGLEQSGAAPRIQVATNLAERSDGVIVALRTVIIANPGTEAEQRIDYTSDYENELMISLSALETAWLANRDKITSEVPLPPANVVADREGGPAEAPGADAAATAAGPPAGGAAAGPGEPPATQPTPAPSSADIVVQAPAPPPPASEPAADARPAQGAAATPAPAPAPPPDAAGGQPSVAATMPPAEPGAPAAANDMLVLRTEARKGLWAYYAEDYARLRGCTLSELGAVLLQETPTYELHEVHCAGSPNLLLRCQGGVCQEMR